MKNFTLIFYTFTCFSGFAQHQLVSSNRELTRPESTATKNQPIVNLTILPLFGEITKTETQKASDARFLKECDQNFPSREDASKFFAERAWEYLAEGEQDTAIYRFNLAYLLNPQNVDSYWGLGVASYQQGRYDESARLLHRGLVLDPENATLMVDVATVQINCFKEKRNCEDIDGALGLLRKAVTLDSTNANTFLKLAVAEYHYEHYDAAWTNLHRCYELDPSMTDLDFVKDLLAKKEDPKGIFR
jgi:tetratricopeptide (TPR) repeat protein